MMKSEQIRELSPEEMQARVKELEEERFRLKFRGATETLDDPLRLRVIRRDIARLNTILAESKKPKAQAKQKTKAGAARAGGR
jgi:large subunit ribosomal protein L29